MSSTKPRKNPSPRKLSKLPHSVSKPVLPHSKQDELLSTPILGHSRSHPLLPSMERTAEQTLFGSPTRGKYQPDASDVALLSKIRSTMPSPQRTPAMPATKWKPLKKASLDSGFNTFLLGSLENLDPTGGGIKIFLEEWLERYVSEQALFSSSLVFAEVKLQELLKITSQLPRANPFRTFICCDLMKKLIDSLSDQRAKAVLTRMFETVLEAIYTDKPSELGLVPYSLLARQYKLELDSLERKYNEAKSRHKLLQKRWHVMLAQWQPAVARTIKQWATIALTIMFYVWRSWARTIRLRHGLSPVATSRYFGNTPAHTWADKIKACRTRSDVRIICGQFFSEWREITLQSQLKLMLEKKQQLEIECSEHVFKGRGLRRVKFVLTEQLEATQQKLTDTLRANKLLLLELEHASAVEEELRLTKAKSQRMLSHFTDMVNLLVSSLDDAQVNARVH
jgi:hypothetical protein